MRIINLKKKEKMNREIKRFLLTFILIVLNVGIAYALSKFLNEPYSNIVAWMALGSTCSIYAEKLVE